MRSTLAFVVIAFAACGPPRYVDVTGPYTGPVHQFRIDRFALPGQKADFAPHLTADNSTDNQLAFIVGIGEEPVLGLNQPPAVLGDLIGSGALRITVDIQSDDPALREDASVGVTLHGGDGLEPGLMGGRLHAGKLVTNPIDVTHLPAPSQVSLPILGGADLWRLPLVATELTLVSDGKGGFDGVLGGGARAPSDLHDLYSLFLQVIDSHPSQHVDVIHFLDQDGDGTVSYAEFSGNGLVKTLVEPSVSLFDAAGHWDPQPPDMHARSSDSFGIGVGFHLVRCVDASCTLPSWQPTCSDRVRNGDETDVDCGGSCGGCAPGGGCVSDGDCQTRCVAGVCAEPSCHDGVWDGFETDVDCGLACGSNCPPGRRCIEGHDCGSGVCNGNICA
jgi:hypothetical protein